MSDGDEKIKTLVTLLEDAVKHLKIAGTEISICASGTKPLRAAKFLNILGKETHQLSMELRIFLGDLLDDKMAWEIPKQPSLNILKRMKEEGEL